MSRSLNVPRRAPIHVRPDARLLVEEDDGYLPGKRLPAVTAATFAVAAPYSAGHEARHGRRRPFPSIDLISKDFAW